jgi:hypothetical protein
MQQPSRQVRVVLSPAVDLHAFIEWVTRIHEQPVDILLSTPVARTVRNHFPINTQFEQLQRKERIRVRTANSDGLTAVVSGPQRLHVSVQLGDFHSFVPVDAPAFHQTFRDEFEAGFEDGDSLETGVSPWDELLTELKNRVGVETKREYVRLIETGVENECRSFDAISLAIIAAALTGGLQSDLATWGEETQLASPATFSRRKSALEEDGLIDSEKVQIGMGRPPLRLRPGDRFEDLFADTGAESDEISHSAIPTKRTQDPGTQASSDEGVTSGAFGVAVERSSNSAPISSLPEINRDRPS